MKENVEGNGEGEKLQHEDLSYRAWCSREYVGLRKGGKIHGGELQSWH